MQDNKNGVFADGLFVRPPHEKAPDFVKGRISINRERIIQWLETKQDEWLNFDVLENKKDNTKWFAKLNTWKKEDQEVSVGIISYDEAESDDDILADIGM